MALPEYAFYNIINGERRPRAAESGNGAAAANGDAKSTAAVHYSVDPRTEEQLWPCPVATTEDLEDAITAANAAFPAWAQTPVAERQKLLVRIAEQIKAHEEEFTDLLRRETGKSKIVAAVEITNTIDQTMYYSSIALEDEVQYEDDDVRIVATHPPLGVVGAICPWNFPLILCNLKVVSALLTGNCAIVKPSPFTPYVVLRWIELCQDLLPPGVLQAVNGGADLGALMTQHPGIHKISFTGTIATGKRVMASCAQTLKKVTLELAGNDAAIVFADVADEPGRLDAVVAQTVAGSFFNTGQMCVATKRVYVHESIYDAFLEKFVAETNKHYAPAVPAVDAAVDDALPTVFGPVSNKMQFDIVKTILAEAKTTGGGRVVAGGNVREGKGFWMEPTVVAEPSESSLLVKEEQFGPIIPILKWKTDDEVVARANLANAGLGATVYSKDLAKARHMADRLEAGSVWINTNEKPNVRAFFGGFKDSGFGGEMGKQGLLSYAYTKSIHIPKEKKASSAASSSSIPPKQPPSPASSPNPFAALFSCFKRK
ncbi:Aldehyde dehydrogenase domain protein [Niveomyces insectorum RCEF 264]|uniref:aldehyde dehydrogenase (NAD(+)) n=1 Tax=Niveomyces insectorum RCEF 264 TaxID=1081102 RepID=A0A167QH73_9HYPO|nr:Aldehyde dehydrogenase domain protein [Niveomyces insectorum RCEF 264]